MDKSSASPQIFFFETRLTSNDRNRTDNEPNKVVGGQDEMFWAVIFTRELLIYKGN